MTQKNTLSDTWLTALIWCAFMGSALFLRPLLPIDETRYITVAWEMWVNDNYMVPHLNGELYSHKPPLLFWLMKLGWLIAGVTETWARLVAPLFGLAALWLTARLARELWPTADQTRAAIAPLMMVSGLYWAVFSTMTMFDMMLTVATLIAVLGYVKAWKGFTVGTGFWTGMAIAGLGIGLGALAKGPAILVHTLPVALFAPLWGPALTDSRGKASYAKWYGGVFASVTLGVAIVLAWAIPAAIIGGAEYRDAIFIKQSADRMVKSFAHRRPAYWFVWVLPLMLLPWTLWPRLWREGRGLRTQLKHGTVRILLIWAGASFVIFSAISGKQPHYLLPVFPALALFAAYLLTQKSAAEDKNGRGHLIPVLVLLTIAVILLVALLGLDQIAPLLNKPLPTWAHAANGLWLIPAVILTGGAAFMRTQSPKGEVRLIAVAVASLMVFVHLAAAPAFTLAYDLERSAKTIKAFQDAERPVAYVGKYHGEFHFLGRLERPITVLGNMAAGKAWAAANPTGVVIATLRESAIPADSTPLSVRPYRGKVLAMWDAARF